MFCTVTGFDAVLFISWISRGKKKKGRRQDGDCVITTPPTHLTSCHLQAEKNTHDKDLTCHNTNLYLNTTEGFIMYSSADRCKTATCRKIVLKVYGDVSKYLRHPSKTQR